MQLELPKSIKFHLIITVYKCVDFFLCNVIVLLSTHCHNLKCIDCDILPCILLILTHGIGKIERIVILTNEVEKKKTLYIHHT